MNISAKCNCCVCEPVCKYKEIYKHGVENIFWKLKDCPHIEVSIKCPHMVTGSMARGNDNA